MASDALMSVFASWPYVKACRRVADELDIWPGAHREIISLACEVVAQSCHDGIPFAIGSRIRRGNFSGTVVGAKPQGFRDRWRGAKGGLMAPHQESLVWLVIDQTRGVSQGVAAEWQPHA